MHDPTTNNSSAPVPQPAPDTSWENKDFHCPVCFALFSDDDANDAYPFFVCGNHHTLCRACLASVLLSDHAACPQCRTDLQNTGTSPNRLVLQFMQQLRLPCGACASTALLSVREAHEHLLESRRFALFFCSRAHPYPASSHAASASGFIFTGLV